MQRKRYIFIEKGIIKRINNSCSCKEKYFGKFCEYLCPYICKDSCHIKRVLIII